MNYTKKIKTHTFFDWLNFHLVKCFSSKLLECEPLGDLFGSKLINTYQVRKKRNIAYENQLLMHFTLKSEKKIKTVQIISCFTLILHKSFKNKKCFS
jgi:hypothetical protein